MIMKASAFPWSLIGGLVRGTLVSSCGTSALESIHKDRARDVSIGICTSLFVENGWRTQVEFGAVRCCEKKKMKQKSYSKKARLKHVFKGTKDPGIGLDG